MATLYHKILALSRAQWTTLVTGRYMITMMVLLCYVNLSGGQECTDSVNVQQIGNNVLRNGRLAIFPRLNFTCNGRITSITAGVWFDDLDYRNSYPYFQVWRAESVKSTIYNKISEVQLQLDDQETGSGDYQATNTILTGNNTMEVQSGDVVGFYHPFDTDYRVMTIKTDGYIQYQFTGSPESVNLNITDDSDNKRQPLIQFTIDIQCDDLSTPSNGEIVSCSSGRVGVGYEGDTCSFTCNTGYELTGSDTRTCQSDGSWSGSDDVCSIQREASTSSSGSVIPIVAGSVGGATLFIVIISLCVVILLVKQSHKLKTHANNRMVTETSLDVNMTTNPSYSVTKQKQKQESQYDYVLPNSIFNNQQDTDANSLRRRVEGAHDETEPEYDIVIQDNPSYSSVLKDIEAPEDESKHIHTESSSHSTQRAADSARIVVFATMEEKGVSDDMEDIKIDPNPSYDIVSGAVKLEDNPSYNKIKHVH